MKQLWQSIKDNDSYPSLSSLGSIISLTDDNENDCYGILPPIQKSEVVIVFIILFLKGPKIFWQSLPYTGRSQVINNSSCTYLMFIPSSAHIHIALWPQLLLIIIFCKSRDSFRTYNLQHKLIVINLINDINITNINSEGLYD